MRRIFISILLLSLIFIAMIFSGCIDDKPESVLDKETECAGGGKSDNMPNMIETSNSEPSVQPDKVLDAKDSLLQLEHFIDPNLKHVRIESSNPDIEVVRFELDDRRDWEGSTNYHPNVLVSNNGDNPVWINTYTKIKWDRWGDKGTSDGKFVFLKSDERMWLHPIKGRYPETELYTLDKLSTVVITAYKTITPVISPELKNISFNVLQIQGDSPVNIHSIKYEVTNDKHQWKYVTIGVSRENRGGSTQVQLITKGGRTYAPLSQIESIPVGKTTYVKLPLKQTAVEDIATLRMTSWG